MTVPDGSVFGLLGPNGAGKTTTLRLLAGLTRATAGRATLAGIPVAADSLEVRRSLGYLEQDPRAYGWMTGRDQLRMLGRLHGIDGAALERAVTDALARVDMTRRGGPAMRAPTPGACASGSGSPAPSSIGRRSRSSTSRSARSTRRAGATCSTSSPRCAARPRSCSRPTSSRTSSGSATGSGSSPTAGSSSRARSRSCSTATRCPSIASRPSPARVPRSTRSPSGCAPTDWVTGVGVEHGLAHRRRRRSRSRAGREILPARRRRGDRRSISVARARPDARGRVPAPHRRVDEGGACPGAAA